ncbi:MAG: hypothetical protein HOY79_35005 [Streptomyces sp.]|nr:hypothetical protein [Streptomyces sp.]
MSRLTLEQAADRLGIADEHVDVFPGRGRRKQADDLDQVRIAPIGSGAAPSDGQDVSALPAACAFGSLWISVGGSIGFIAGPP